MFIKRLEVFGFKSFPYKVSIPFSPGITAIVGPNGAGKSNIVDALKWVLGEQSPKRLRVKELSDLIFSGSPERKVDFAEVKLIINHSPPVWEKFKELSEIVVTRRFYRSGEGEFYINQKPCRLKDIQFLFADLGISSQSYGIIEQGEITRFVEMSPKERKVFLEDLAGVSRVKFTEEEVKRNLKKTQENLVRLEDVLREVGVQYEHLKRQSEEARVYLKLKRSLDFMIVLRALFLKEKVQRSMTEASLKIRELKEIKEKLKKDLESLEIEENQGLQHVLLLERKIADVKAELKAQEESLSRVKERFYSMTRQERELQQKLERQSIKAESEKEKLTSIEEELRSVSEKLEELKKRAESVKKALDEKKTEKSKLEEELKKVNEKFRELQSKIAELQSKRNQILERKRLLSRELSQQVKELEWIENSYKVLLKQWQELKAQSHAWNEVIEAKEEEKESLLAELTELKNEISLKSQDLTEVQKKKSEVLQELRSARDRLKLLDKIFKKVKVNIPKAAETYKPLGSVLSIKKEDLEVLETALGDLLSALVVKDLEEALELSTNSSENLIGFFASEDPNRLFKVERIEDADLESIKRGLKESRFLYISKSKLLFSPFGFFFVLKKSKKGFFSLEKEKKELNELIKRLEEKLSKLESLESSFKSEVAELKGRIKQIEERVKGLEAEIKKVQEKRQEFLLASERLKEKKAALEEKREEINKKKERVSQELKGCEEELKLFDERLKSLEKEFKVLDESLKRRKKALREVENELKVLYEKVVEIKTQRDSLIGRKSDLEAKREKAVHTLRNFRFEKERLEKEITYIRDRVKELKKELSAKEERVLLIKKELSKLLEEKEKREKEVKQIQLKERDLEKELRKLENKEHSLSVTLTELEIKLDAIKKELEEFEGDFVEEVKKELTSKEINLREVEGEIERLKKELKEFKEVNLASIREFELVKERYENMIKQKEELEISIKELKDILENLKQTSREKLLRALEEVNAKLENIFPVAFPGGKAKLVLTEEDPLEAGLELKIHIPGKNIRHLHMLSGGEKALCVITILIAFYLVKPGAFCILDEVDAPLDEKNSIQFVKMLELIKKNSQVILVTHNPNIMKEVDTLLGVTMEEKGISKVVVLKLNNIQKKATLRTHL